MTGDAKQALLDAANRDDAIAALQHTFRWAIEQLPTAPAGMATVFAIDDALTASAEFQRVVGDALRAGGAGAGVLEYSEAHTAALAALRDDIETARRDASAARDRESELARQKEELAELRGLVDRVRRMEALHEALDELRAHEAALAARAAELVTRTSGLESGVATMATRVRALSDTALAALAGPDRDAVAQAQAATRALDEETATIDALRVSAEASAREVDALRAERLGTLASLRAHEQADRDLVRALDGLGSDGASSLDRVRRELEAAGQRLRDVDEALGQRLAAAESAYRTERQQLTRT